MKSLKVEWVIVTLKRLVDERIWQTHRKKITVIFIFFSSDPVSYLKVSENLKVSWSIENTYKLISTDIFEPFSLQSQGAGSPLVGQGNLGAC